MFGIEYISSNGEEQLETFNLYEKRFELRKKQGWFSIIPCVCLCVTSAVVIGVTLIVFVDGLILNVIYLPPNQKCPEDGDTDCYSTYGNSYFYCNSSDTSIPNSMGSVLCYRWFKKGISTLEILEQIGLCAGLIQVFNWMVQLYLRLLLYIYAFPSEMARTNCAHPLLALLCTCLALFSPIITIVVLTVRKVGVTGLTMAFVSGTLVIVITMLVLIWTWRRNTRLMVEAAKLSNNTAAHKSTEMTVVTVETQQRSAEISTERWASPV